MIHARRFALAATLAWGCIAATAMEAECGGDTPCAIEGGTYHARAPEAPVGAVVFLHGWGGTSDAAIANASLVDPLLDRGYAVIAPQGLPRREGEPGGRWNSMDILDGRDDVAFVRDAVYDAAERFGFPRDRVLAAGFSGGGMMVWRIACDAPGSFAAYAPVSGLLWRPLPEACAGPVRLQHTHGWADTVVPIEGRSVGGGILTQGDLFRGLEILRRASGCERDDPDAYDHNGEMMVRVWEDCAPGGQLELVLHPGGHGIPAGWVPLALDWFEAGLGESG